MSRQTIPGTLNTAALTLLADLPAGAQWRHAPPPPTDPAERLHAWLRKFWHRHRDRRQDFQSVAVLAAIVPIGLRFPDYEKVIQAAVAAVSAGGEP